MATLSDYYRDLLEWEGAPAQSLIDAWPLDLVARVGADFRQALLASPALALPQRSRAQSSRQHIGNQVEEIFLPPLAKHLQQFTLRKCPGAGYPDQMLECRQRGQHIGLEIKATATWNPADSQRRVLTSSSAKLRNQFTSPRYHLLGTFIYQAQDDLVTLGQLRLDFLEPSTPVSVRLEASVSQKILATGQHHHLSLTPP